MPNLHLSPLSIYVIQYLIFPFVSPSTLTSNNLTSLWPGTFEDSPRLRALRVANNKLICDCHLGWLGRWVVAGGQGAGGPEGGKQQTHL